MPAKKTASTKAKTTKSKKSASPKTRTALGKSKAKTKAGDKEVTIDRRRMAGRDKIEEVEVAALPAEQPQLERREKVQRRRQIDPTTCERDYSDQEVEFMNAMDEYKRTSGRMFPTCSEVLEVIRELGYTQLTPAELATVRPEPVDEVTAAEDDTNKFEDGELEAVELAF